MLNVDGMRSATEKNRSYICQYSRKDLTILVTSVDSETKPTTAVQQAVLKAMHDTLASVFRKATNQTWITTNENVAKYRARMPALLDNAFVPLELFSYSQLQFKKRWNQQIRTAEYYGSIKCSRKDNQRRMQTLLVPLCCTSGRSYSSRSSVLYTTILGRQKQIAVLWAVTEKFEKMLKINWQKLRKVTFNFWSTPLGLPNYAVEANMHVGWPFRAYKRL